MTEQNQDWQERFDSQFGQNGRDEDHYFRDIKQFISSLLAEKEDRHRKVCDEFEKEIVKKLEICLDNCRPFDEEDLAEIISKVREGKNP